MIIRSIFKLKCCAIIIEFNTTFCLFFQIPISQLKRNISEKNGMAPASMRLIYQAKPLLDN